MFLKNVWRCRIESNHESNYFLLNSCKLNQIHLYQREGKNWSKEKQERKRQEESETQTEIDRHIMRYRERERPRPRQKQRQRDIKIN